MGQSQQSSEKPKEFLHNFHDKSRFEDNKDTSSYRGIRSENTSFEKEESSKTRSVSNASDKNNLTEVTLKWTNGGKEVFVTGSFANWKQWFTLEKQGDIFCRKILLPKEKHYFKFIVDKEWKYSTSYETQSDEKGNVNNFVDLTKVSNRKGTGPNTTSTNNTTNEGGKSPNNFKKDIKRKKPDITTLGSYSDLKPERSGLNSDTPLVPCSYSNAFKIDNMSNQEYKGNRNFLRCDSHAPAGEVQYSNCNMSSGSIGIPPHVNM